MPENAGLYKGCYGRKTDGDTGFGDTGKRLGTSQDFVAEQVCRTGKEVISVDEEQKEIESQHWKGKAWKYSGH